MSLWSQPLRLFRHLAAPDEWRLETLRQWPSAALHRGVDIDVYLPPDYDRAKYRRYPLVLFNDGQDLPRADFGTVLDAVWRSKLVPYFIAVGVYASADRIREYGTAHRADYKGRGDRAGWYRDFILTELLPHLQKTYRLSRRREETIIAGFSLGGLSAIDIAWAHPEVFGGVGVFSGSFWWRAVPVDPADPDSGRIFHELLRNTAPTAPDQRFWFQCGTLDEMEDRNGNGVIDAIDDTLDLIAELRAHGYGDSHIRYYEMEGGEHNPETWGRAMPDFLRWVLG